MPFIRTRRAAARRRARSLVLKDTLALPEGSVVTSRTSQGCTLTGIRGSGNSFTVERSTLTQQMQKPEFLSQALMVPNAGGGFLCARFSQAAFMRSLACAPAMSSAASTANDQQHG